MGANILIHSADILAFKQTMSAGAPADPSSCRASPPVTVLTMTYPFDRIAPAACIPLRPLQAMGMGHGGLFFLVQCRSMVRMQNRSRVSCYPSLLGPSAGLGRSPELRQRWEGHRRQEILQLQFEQHAYGKAPHQGF